ncbi:light-regulated signal transduction histidine kinase (bacteriophytochrome) [Mucilaginibacter sp. UYCu711]
MSAITEGTGIGLYLIRKIVNASGGKIEVECAAGNGCTFKIYFKNDNRPAMTLVS